MHQDKPLLQEYIGQAITTEYELVDSCPNQLADIPSQEIKIKIDEDEVETSDFGIMFLSASSPFCRAARQARQLSIIRNRMSGLWRISIVTSPSCTVSSGSTQTMCAVA